METNNKLEIITHKLKDSFSGGFIEGNQKILFFFDEYMKGKTVGIKLYDNSTEDYPDKGLETQDSTIYFSNKDLKKILEFLIDSEKE